MFIRITPIFIGVLVTSIISFTISLLYFNNFPDGYGLMLVFPLIYTFIYTLAFNKKLSNVSRPITMLVFLGLEWIRFVGMPPLIAISGENSGESYINPTLDSLYLGTFLMLFEFLVGTIFLHFVLKTSKVKEIKRNSIRLTGNKGVYSLFLVFAIGVLLYFQRNTNLVNFGFVSVGTGTRIGDHTDTILILAQQIILVGMIVLFTWVLDYSYRKYTVSKKKFFVNVSLFVAIVNVCIIIGERRSAQLFAGFCSVMLLAVAFPEQRKRILTIVGGSAVTVISVMSIYKFSYAFLYDSYGEALANSDFNVFSLAKMLQSYFSGPEIIAATIDFASYSNLNISNMIFDFLRSTFPISLLLKSEGHVTSVLFNSFIYSGTQSTGHILPAVGYGFLYLGALFSPLILVFNIFVSTWLEKKMFQTTSYEMMYVWAYLLMRFVMNLFVNSPALISPVTIMLFSGGFLFLFARILQPLFLRNNHRVLERVY
jgi:hypothetical protein